MRSEVSGARGQWGEGLMGSEVSGTRGQCGEGSVAMGRGMRGHWDTLKGICCYWRALLQGIVYVPSYETVT